MIPVKGNAKTLALRGIVYYFKKFRAVKPRRETEGRSRARAPKPPLLMRLVNNQKLLPQDYFS